MDQLATWLVTTFMSKLRKYPTYRHALHTQSILTITSNVVYGKATGNTPDGRRKGEPFAPGANPMHGRDSHGIHAAAASVAKIPYRDAADGISLTRTLVPEGLGGSRKTGIRNLTGMLDAFFSATGFHMNVNVLNRDMLLDAMDHPGEVSQSDDPCVGLRGELRAAHPRTADGRHQPDVPRGSRCHDRRAMTITTTSLEASEPVRAARESRPHVPESDVRTALATGDMGFLHSFTTGSTVDGPGVRVVAWTTGCMWRCLYCHNPDTWTMTNGIPVTWRQAAEELRKYRPGLKIMSGGLTISGGEPLMQHRFVVKLFAAAKAMGIHTTLETNGYFGDRLTDQELESIDLVMLGIKAWDPDRHRRLTGMELEPTLAFARRLAAQKRKIWVRFVLVPGLTDDAEDIADIARFAAGLGNVERVEVLPFHQMGRFKWKRLAWSTRWTQSSRRRTSSPSRCVGIFRAEGLKAY